MNRMYTLGPREREPMFRPQTFALGGILLLLIWIWL
jgi:hypothetical protein